MSARPHEQPTRTFGSDRRVLDVWLPFRGAGGFETDGGGVLVVVEGDAAIASVSGPQRPVCSGRLLSFRWLKHEEEESTTAEKHSWEGYTFAALIFFFLFLDNLLRHIEGQGWDAFWPCSGRLEVVILYVVLSLLAQLAYWARVASGLNQDRN
jgi:hypothetical protein